jgi:hypothetical protein
VRWIVSLALACSFACTDDEARRCLNHSECDAFQRCVDGFCQTIGTPFDAGPRRDAGRFDAVFVRRDARPPQTWDSGAVDACVPEAEACDGFDDDCDERIDEGALRSFYTDRDGDGHGAGAPIMACTAGMGQVRSSDDCNDDVAAIRPGASETCNEVDDDCDGATDPGCACVDGRTMSCGPPLIGECRPGTQTCVGGGWGDCLGGVGPTSEVCGDGRDSDCEGNDSNGVTNRCGGCGPEPAEVCDGGDNDCDGATDNGACGGYDGCFDIMFRGWSCCEPLPYFPEACDYCWSWGRACEFPEPYDTIYCC